MVLLKMVGSIFIFFTIVFKVVAFTKRCHSCCVLKSNNCVNSNNDIFKSRAKMISMTLPSITTSDPITVYEAQLPEPQVLMGFGALVLILSLTSLFWWKIIIPQQRTKVAISKSRGEIRDFLEKLETLEPSKNLELKSRVQKWLFTDWLKQRENRTAKPAALPFLKKAKWNSGDNPILAAIGGIMAFVVASSLAERAMQ